MNGKLLGIRIFALLGAALISAIGMAPYDFVYYTGLGAL